MVLSAVQAPIPMTYGSGLGSGVNRTAEALYHTIDTVDNNHDELTCIRTKKYHIYHSSIQPLHGPIEACDVVSESCLENTAMSFWSILCVVFVIT